MPFTFRFTDSGRQKQLRDEASAWGLLINALVGTPNHGLVNGLAVRDPVTNAITGVNIGSANYPRWREAHRRLTRRARIDRQREQRAAAAGPPYHAAPGVPNRVDPTLVIRDTIRVAALHTRTSEDYGGGTMLNAGANNTKATLAQLHQHLDSVLGAIEERLLNAATFREDHDLRAAGRPPLQVLLSTEWYFRIPNRPFTLAERNQILTDLEALSAKYPEWLIVPGSIFWSPDLLTNATVRVYNQAPAFFGGAQLAIRTKREQHDIDSDLNVRAKQRWGPDYPVAVPLTPPPPSVTAASQGLCSFALRGRTFCVEICRDQYVGDAVKGYLAAGLAGADIFLFTYNGTTPNLGFLPVVHNGIAVFCDGTGQGAHQFLRVTRLHALTHNWTGALVHPFTQYRNNFEPERDHDVLSGHGFNEARLIENDNDANFAAFMAKYNSVFETDPTLDPVLKLAIDGGVGPVEALAAGAVRPYHQKGRRIEELLVGGFLPTGVPIPLVERNAVTPYAAALVQFGDQELQMRATSAATTLLKNTASNGYGVATAGLNPGVVAFPAFSNLTCYQLQDL